MEALCQSRLHLCINVDPFLRICGYCIEVNVDPYGHEDLLHLGIEQTCRIGLTVRPFLRWFRRNSTKPCIESQREAQYLQKTLLEWAQSGDVSIGLLAPFDDDGQGETLKRFEQAFGRRASRFAPGIPGLKSCQLCSLSR